MYACGLRISEIINLPVSAASGEWQFSVQFGDQTLVHSFYVDALPPEPVPMPWPRPGEEPDYSATDAVCSTRRR